MKVDTLVIGIGNVLWADEGFGVRAVEALNQGWRFPGTVALMDGGTLGLYLLPHVQAARRLLVFDAIDYRLAPGSLHVVANGGIPRYLGVGKMSPHQSSFEEVLALAQLSGQCPEDAVLVGVQPDVLTDFGGSLSPAVRSRMPEALREGLATLAAWGVAGVPRGDRAPPLMDASLDLDVYEDGRPDGERACRVGDERFLSIRRAAES
jgi:hydrogenase maturation protease